jgi:hypothetical protein
MAQTPDRALQENGSVTLFMLRGRGRESRLQSLVDVGSTMSEPEKKGSPWPWVLVPIAAISMFFVLRECRQHLPPAPDHVAAPAASVPPKATPAEPATAPQAETPAPEPAPAPQ